MEQKNSRAIVSLLLAIIFLAACSAPPVPPTTQAQSTESPAPATGMTATSAAPESVATEPAAGEGQSLCASPFYPVEQGATWSYKSTGGPAGDYSFTDTITAVREDGFTLTTQIGDLSRSQDWDCTAEGLVARQLGGAPAAMLNSQGIQLTLDAANASGAIFPRQISSGDQWQHTLDFSGEVSVMNEEARATGTAQMNFTALGNESVTVPAGAFDAMKIQIDTTLNIEASYEGITLPVTFSGTYTYWFAEDVGWVKATGTGNLLARSFTETIELQSYSIP